MSEYKPTIGLEIHVELKTKSKMFCSCANLPDEDKPNVHICPICMGHPGTLPVLNKEAIKHVIKFGLAIEGNIADFTEWDRKNYFYPDIPKGYQISQYKYPLVSGGKLGGIDITRVHLEEDTASSTHDTHERSLVNFNRAGVPLMELVTEPVIHTGEDAANFARELQLILRSLKVGEANLEKGEMRIEANVSISKDEKLGVKTEIKNLNSFKSVEKAINFEINRQKELLENGERIVQETRGWDEKREETFSQRVKEDSQDYRYFPDPDIPKLFISELFKEEDLLAEIGELPSKKKGRLIAQFGLSEKEADIVVKDEDLSNYIEQVLKLVGGSNIRLAINYILTDYVGLVNKGEYPVSRINPVDFADLINLISTGKVSSRGAKEILKIMYQTAEKPLEISISRHLVQESNEEELLNIAKKIVDEGPKVVLEFKSGKTSVLQYFIGQAMKVTKGNANPEILRSIFEKLLK